MARETLGKISTDLLKKQHKALSPIEYMQEMLTDYDKNIQICIDRYRKVFLGDFFVVVITKKEPLLKNVLRSYFTARLSCPTPDYDQAVYQYHLDKDSIEFLWVIPSKDTCELFKSNATVVDKSEWQLLRYVLQFCDGTLFKQCKVLNGEEKDSPMVEKIKGDKWKKKKD